MLCREIINIIEETYPRQAALSWDNVGLLVGRSQKEVKKIYVALDATDEVIEQVIAEQADMLITHHPLIFSSLKTITDEQFIGSRVVTLLQHDISYYAMHTNYDVLGMADLSAQMMGLQEVEILEVTNEDAQQGIGRIGSLRPLTLSECCELVKEKFGLQTVALFGEKERQVKRIAISPGSGKSIIDIALQKGAEVLITGDIPHHEGIDAVAQGLAIIDAGHYGLEHIFMEDMATFLKKQVTDIEVVTAKIDHPFQVL